MKTLKIDHLLHLRQICKIKSSKSDTIKTFDGDKDDQGKNCWYKQRRIFMQKNSLKLKIKENPFSLESVEAKKVSRNGEFNNWNLHEDSVYQLHREESTDSPDVIKMVPCPPCVWG
jgi:hypothetical protein